MVVSGTLGDVLEAEGYSVTRCGDAASALSLTRQGCFDIVITDHVMPGMKGVEMTRRMRFRCPGSFIIGISAGHKKKDFIEAGADAYLNKPFTVLELLVAIRKCTGEDQG
jgi:DNA-binding response OmpR family regulator